MLVGKSKGALLLAGVCWSAFAVPAFGQSTAPAASAGQQTPAGGPQDGNPAVAADQGVAVDRKADGRSAATDRPVAGEGAAGGDIIVQARRVSERLQDVPLSITALDPKALDRQQITQSQDLQRVVPGVVVRATAGSNDIVFAVRGQSVDFFSNSQPGVLPYLNDVQNASIGSLDFYDLASLQVVKGPQGTLFGRNATGGAVLIYTAKPNDQLEGFANLKVGDYSAVQATAALNLPLSEVVQLRLAGEIQRRDGYIKDLVTGADYNNRHSDSGRVSLRIAPSATIENVTVGSYQRVRERSGVNLLDYVQPGSTAALVFGNPGFIAANPRFGPAGIFSRLAAQQAAGPWKAFVYSPPVFNADQWAVSNTTKVDASDKLSVKNIFGYAHQKVNSFITQGGTDIGLAVQIPSPNGPTLDAWQWSDELQLIGKAFDDKFEWLVGGFHSAERRTRNIQAVSLLGLPTVNGGNGRANNSSSVTRGESTAVFAQGTYHLDSLLRGLSVVAGGRWTWDKTRFYLNPGSALAPTGSTEQQLKEDKPSWLAGLNYKVSADLLLYAVTRGSWRTGGFNYFSPLAVNRFEPETTKDVELGVKSSGAIGGRPFTFNLAVYRQTVDNAQRLATGLVNGGIALVTFNAPGGARVQGVEAAGTLAISSALRLSANYTFTDAIYRSPTTATVLGAPFELVHYADVPRHSGSVAADLDLPLPSGPTRIQAHLDAYVQSRQYYSNTTDPNGAILPSYGLVNGKLTLANVAGTRISVALYVRNMLNKEYYIGGASNTKTLGYDSVTPGEPRMFGGELHYAF